MNMKCITARRGLATLEIVMALPMLLFVMALMINFGTAASWKVRTLCVARNKLWGNRAPRSTSNDPRPAKWPLQASTSVFPLGPQLDLDGPQTTDLGPGGLVISPKSDALDPTLGMLEEQAGLTQRFPLMQRWPPYHLTGRTDLLDNTWEFQRMGIAYNTDMRIPVVYTLPSALNQEVYAEKYKLAAIEILKMLSTVAPGIGEPALGVLDREVDFITYGRIIQQFDPRKVPGCPDFHPPRSGPGIGADLATSVVLVNNWVYGIGPQFDGNGLIDQIKGGTHKIDGISTPPAESIPKFMTKSFILFYTQTIMAYLNAGQTPPPELQKNANTLERYLLTLQN
jgi:hypothetical protein